MHAHDMGMTDPRDEKAICADCGIVFAPRLYGAYYFDRQLICFDCALRRGGKFDAERETWTIVPSLAGLREVRPNA